MSDEMGARPARADDGQEPGEMTERFRAFSAAVDPEPNRTVPMIIALGAAVVVAVVVVLFLVL